MTSKIKKWPGYNFYANLPENEFISFRETGYAIDIAKRLDRSFPDLYDQYDVLWFFQLVHDKENWNQIKGFTKPLILFIVGHESPELPESLKNCAAVIFKQYLGLNNIDKTTCIFRIPVGPSSVFPDIPLVPFHQRNWNVFFAGNLHNGRKRLYQELTGINFLPFPVLHRSRKLIGTNFSHKLPDSIINFSNQFHSGLTSKEYANCLAHSKIVLCPYGVSQKETMRHFEALKQGCVVVTDKMPETYYFKGAPFIVIQNWKNIRNELRHLLNEPEYIEKKSVDAYNWWLSMCSVEAVIQYIRKNTPKLLYQLEE